MSFDQPTDALREFLSARHECLSGHEFALPCTADERRGAQLLAQALEASGVRPQAACDILGAGRADQSLEVIVVQALGLRRLDVLVHRCDEAFDLDLESRVQMAP